MKSGRFSQEDAVRIAIGLHDVYLIAHIVAVVITEYCTRVESSIVLVLLEVL